MIRDYYKRRASQDKIMFINNFRSTNMASRRLERQTMQKLNLMQLTGVDWGIAHRSWRTFQTTLALSIIQIMKLISWRKLDLKGLRYKVKNSTKILKDKEPSIQYYPNLMKLENKRLKTMIFMPVITRICSNQPMLIKVEMLALIQKLN